MTFRQSAEASYGGCRDQAGLPPNLAMGMSCPEPNPLFRSFVPAPAVGSSWRVIPRRWAMDVGIGARICLPRRLVWERVDVVVLLPHPGIEPCQAGFDIF